MTGYDIFGDIHGHGQKLIQRLNSLGYRESDGAYRHAGRIAIFVGDLIDRGPNQVATVNIIRRMVDAGSALCALGNHEFNSVAWATPDANAAGEHLRRHQAKNRHQHQAFLSEVEGTPLHDELIAWFKTLPLWLDLGEIRVVHACWNDTYMASLKPQLGTGNTLTDELFVLASRKGLPEYEAVEAICKGLEISLPPGASFQDKDGNERHKARIKWWAPDLTSLRNTMVPGSIPEDMTDMPLPTDPRLTPYEGPPVFFGHYWLSGTPKIQAKNIACVDYSAGKNGPLVTYRWDGEPELRNENFVVTAT